MKTITEVLSEMPEWMDDWKSHALFCAYDQDTSEEFVVSFWKRAINKIFDEHLTGLSIEIEELRVLVHRKGRYPMGLIDIVNELIKREDVVSVEILGDMVDSKVSSQTWGSWIGKKLKNYWKPVLTTTKISSPLKLKRFSTKITDYCREKDRSTFLITEIQSFFSLNNEDFAILMNYMFLQGNSLQFKEIKDGSLIEMVKFRISPEEELTIRPEDSAIVSLNLMVDEIDKKLHQLNETKEFLNRQAIAELKTQSRTNAKHFLIRRKMVEKKIEQLHGCRLNVEEQILSISTSMTNKNIIHTLKLANTALKSMAPDINEVTELIDTSKDNIRNFNEVGNMLGENVGDEAEEELMKEFDMLGVEELPSVPDYELKRPEVVKKEVRDVIIN